MTSRELFDRIQTWCSGYPQIPIPPQTPELEAIRLEIENNTINGQLQNVSQLEVTEELVGTPVEADLRRAIDFANASDASKLGEIHSLLRNVQKYMREKGLC